MKKAFTLIELLIVVAIIAILAAIAVPNFLEAQVRAKVSRVKSDLRTEATALEAYAVDANVYPYCNIRGTALSYIPDEPTKTLERLSTPIAYLSNALVKDVFTVKGRYSAATAAAINAIATATPVNPGSDAAASLNSYIYQSWNTERRAELPVVVGVDLKARAWLLHSCGPDSNYYNLGGVIANDDANQIGQTINFIYDPTNGTISRGSIWRTGGSAPGVAPYVGGTGLVAAIQTQR